MVPHRVSSDSDENRAGIESQSKREQSLRCSRESVGNGQERHDGAVDLGCFGTAGAFEELGRNMKAAGKAVGKQLDRMGHNPKAAEVTSEKGKPQSTGPNSRNGARMKRMIPAIVAALPRIALAVLLVVGALGRMERDYYLILRWTAFGVAGYTAYVAYARNHVGLAWVFFLVALFFNPAVSPPITRESWQVVDVACALFLLWSVYLLPPSAGDDGKVRRAHSLPLMVLGVTLIGLITLSEYLGPSVSGSKGSSVFRQAQPERREAGRTPSGLGGNGRGGSGRSNGGR